MDLDDPDLLDRADPSGLLPEVAAAPARLREAAFLAAELPPDPLDGERPRALVVAGAGEVSQAGHALAAVAGTGCPVPIAVVAGDELPGWVGAADVVVTFGDSPAGDAAYRRGAGLVFLPVPDRPAGAAFWNLLAPMLAVATRLRLVPPMDAEAAAARLDEVTERCRPSKEEFLNPAKSLALRLSGSVPLAVASGPVADVAARRFAAQVASRARVPAAYGDEQLGALAGPRPPYVVLFRDADSSGGGSGAAWPTAYDEVVSDGDTALERLACLVATGDFAAVYLAMLTGVLA